MLTCPILADYGCIETSNHGVRLRSDQTLRLHAGIDLRATTSTRLVAAASGVVVDSIGGPLGEVTIKNEDGKIRYLHLSRIDITLGQEIEKGELIGLSGDTSPVNVDPHLHLEFYKKGGLTAEYCYMTEYMIKCETRMVSSTVDPFRYFVAKQKLIRVKGITSPEKENTFSLALEAKDIEGKTVSSVVNNNPITGYPLSLRFRKIEWSSTNPTVFNIKPKEDSVVNGLIEYGNAIRDRSYAEVKSDGIAGGIINARWEGLDFTASYFSPPVGFYSGYAKITSCSPSTAAYGRKPGDPYTSGCNALSQNFNVGDGARLSFRLGSDSLNMRLDQPYGCSGATSSISGTPGSAFSFSVTQTGTVQTGYSGVSHNTVFTILENKEGRLSGTFQGIWSYPNGVGTIAGEWAAIASEPFAKCFPTTKPRPNTTEHTMPYFCSPYVDTGCSASFETDKNKILEMW